MAKIFLSYSRVDLAFAQCLSSDLEKLNHTVWLDQELSGGQPWWEKILASIRGSDFFLFLLSPSSLDSQACKRE
jgi:predicted nucleotide-binding protein